MLVFKGIQKTTLIDFPGEIACTLFLPKCDFRCPFCHNINLVLERETGVSIGESDAIEFLSERKSVLDGVCITGGEPLLHKGLPAFCKKLKELGFLVKIDTNGSRPEMLEQLLKEKSVDYIAMDIKAAPPKYSEAAGVSPNMEKINKSIGLIKGSSLAYEFRTTVVPKLHGKSDLVSIGKWLDGSKLYVLQQFNPSVPLLDKTLENSPTYTKEELVCFAESLKPFFGGVLVRGI